MAANDSALIVPGHGTVFYAPRGVALPADPLDAFKLNTDAPAGWTDLGHTSKENAVELSKDGGDKSQLDTWYADAVRVVYAAEQWSMTVNALQMTKETLDLAFRGEHDPVKGRYVIPAATRATEGQIVVLMQDTTGSMLIYAPNTQTTLGDAPSINTENFFEVPLSISILSDPNVTADGLAARLEFYGGWLRTSAPATND